MREQPTNRLGVPPRLMVLTIATVALSTQPVFLASAAIGPMGEELGYGAGGLGLLNAAFFVTASLFSAPIGAIVERMGWRSAIRLNAVGTGGVLVLIGVGARNLPSLAVFLMMGAAIYAISNPGANLALSRHGSARRRGVVFGMKHAGIPSSTLLAGVAIPLIVTPLGWRWAYVISAGLAVVVFALVPAEEPLAHAEADTTRELNARKDTLDRRSLVLTSFGAFLASSAPAALGTFTVAAALDTGFSQNAAGWVLAAASAVSIGARFLNGIAVDRRPTNSYVRISGLLVIGGMVMLGLTMDVSAPMFVGLVIVAFGTAWAWPGLLTYTIVTMNPNSPAASTGVSQAGVFLGAGTMPIVIGRLVESRGFPAGWLVAAVAAVGGGIVMWLLGRRFPTSHPG